jgi:hypothetical protein
MTFPLSIVNLPIMSVVVLILDVVLFFLSGSTFQPRSFAGIKSTLTASDVSQIRDNPPGSCIDQSTSGDIAIDIGDLSL